jgi:hypothetical protein
LIDGDLPVAIGHLGDPKPHDGDGGVGGNGGIGDESGVSPGGGWARAGVTGCLHAGEGARAGAAGGAGVRGDGLTTVGGRVALKPLCGWVVTGNGGAGPGADGDEQGLGMADPFIEASVELSRRNNWS